MSKKVVSEISLGGLRGLEGKIPLGSGFNLILGPNNSGKSTILEAIYLVLMVNYTDLRKSFSFFYIQESSRGSPRHAIESLVGESGSGPCAKIEEDGTNQRVCANLSKSIGVFSRGPSIENVVTINMKPTERDCTIKLDLRREEVGVDPSGKCTEETIKAGLITSGILPYNFYDGIIGLLKRTAPKLLRAFEISLGNESYTIDLAADPWNEMVVIVSGEKQASVPFYAIGRGLQRIFQMITLLNLYDVILIDEIESSLHPELMKQLVKHVVHHSTDKQIIVTSQSIEASLYLVSAFINPSKPTANKAEIIDALKNKCASDDKLNYRFSLVVVDKQGNEVKGFKLDGCDAIWHIVGTEDPRLSYVLLR